MDEIGRQNGNLVIVFVASLVEMAVAADYCDTGACNPEEANCQPSCTVHEAMAIVIGTGEIHARTRTRTHTHTHTKKRTAPIRSP